MQRKAEIVLGAVSTVLLLVLGLWCWDRALVLSERLDVANPQTMQWALRCVSVALVALGQVALVSWVVMKLFQNDRVLDVLRASAALAAAVALVSGAALAVAGN